MSNSDAIPWQQRLENFAKALGQLEAACGQDNYIKGLLSFEGHDEKTPRAVIRRNFEAEYLTEEDSEVLLDALQKRDLLKSCIRKRKSLKRPLP